MAFSFDKVCSNVIPKGTYKAQISDITFKTSTTGETSNDMVVRYVITEGEFAKRTVIDTIYEKAFSFRLKPFLKAAGVDTAREFDTAKELYNYGIREAKGKAVMIEVGTRDYNGNTYNQINSVAPMPSSTTSAEDVMKEFDMSPEVMPARPKVTDLEDIAIPDSVTPTAEIASDDFPF